MPTIAEWQTTTTRAAVLGLRILIVAGSHIELLSAATGRVCGVVATWAEVDGWMDGVGMRRAA